MMGAQQSGFSTATRIAGRHQLTLAAVRAGTRFPDAGARRAWPIELHDRPESYVWEPFPDDHVHYIPFGSLVPAEAANIVAVARAIDGVADTPSRLLPTWAIFGGDLGFTRDRWPRPGMRTHMIRIVETLFWLLR